MICPVCFWRLAGRRRNPMRRSVSSLSTVHPGHRIAPVRAALADTSVWEVSGGETRLYLGGTIHALRPSDYPLPEKFGIPVGAMNNLKPGPATNLLLLMELENIGFSPQGVEMHILEQAERDGLPQGSLETPEFQANLIAGLGEGNEDAMVADFLGQISRIEDDMNTAVSAWREGDIDRIDEHLMAAMREQFPEDFEAVFARRNRNWLPQIMAMLEDPEVEFVLVGVGHILREDGLLELLRQEGASVRRLVLPDN